MKHTKGNWFANISGRQPLIYAEETGQSIAVCYDHGGEEEVKANARLIASAPELLEALKNCAIDAGQKLTKKERLERTQFAINAINRAEGR